MAIKFISVNIERDRHINKICNLIQKENQDVICFQEIMQDKAQAIASTFGYFCLFTPTTRHELVDDQWEGIAILSRYPFYNINLHQYAGPSETPAVFTKFPVSVLHQNRRRVQLKGMFPIQPALVLNEAAEIRQLVHWETK